MPQGAVAGQGDRRNQEDAGGASGLTTPHDRNGAPAGDGWRLFDLREAGTWPAQWAPVAYRETATGRYALRGEAPAAAGNRLGAVHGAFMAGFAENCLSIGLEADGRRLRCVTISLAFDYPAAASMAAPIEGELDIVRETGKLQFLRLRLFQGDVTVLHGSGVIRKLPAA